MPATRLSQGQSDAHVGSESRWIPFKVKSLYESSGSSIVSARAVQCSCHRYLACNSCYTCLKHFVPTRVMWLKTLISQHLYVCRSPRGLINSILKPPNRVRVLLCVHERTAALGNCAFKLQNKGVARGQCAAFETEIFRTFVNWEIGCFKKAKLNGEVSFAIGQIK